MHFIKDITKWLIKEKLNLYKLINYINKGDQTAAKEITVKYPYILSMHYKAGDIEKNPFCVCNR